MRLLIPKCNICNEKIYINIIGETRQELVSKVGHNFKVKCDACNNINYYSVYDITAEKGISRTPTGAILGGIIGIIGGPLGIILGSGIGTLLGGASDINEKGRIDNFNQS